MHWKKNFLPSLPSAKPPSTTVAAGAYFCRNNLNVSWKSNLTGILGFSGL